MEKVAFLGWDGTGTYSKPQKAFFREKIRKECRAYLPMDASPVFAGGLTFNFVTKW